MDEANYLVGLQISSLSDDQARIDLRVLDTADGTWVSGFDLSWRGTLSRSQRWELTQSRTDPAYRGRRSAPFESTQFDLLATTIARDLGCQSLRQMHGEYVVLVENNGDSAETLNDVSELIAHNLATYQSMQFTTDPGQANAVLQSKAHTIDSELQQYWATIAPLDPAADLPTLSANAYVQYGAFGADPFTVPRNGQTVLTSANLVRTSDRAACRANESDCVAMQVRTNANAVVFFLNHQKSHGLVRLSDAECRTRTDARIARANQALIQPLPLFSLAPDAASSKPVWTLQPDTDTYYAIAVSDSEAAHVLSQHLQKLPQRCTAAARFGLEGDRLESWMREFVQKVGAFEPYVDWQAIQVRNVY
jgi:hypothetical protein